MSAARPTVGGAAPPVNFRLPENPTLQHAAKLAVTEDKPIILDYWLSSVGPEAQRPFIGVRENKEKLLVKNDEEYTSPIGRIFKSGAEYIIITENSIYLVNAAINNKRIA